MPRIQKGEVRNPEGCPKGAHNTGRPADWLRAKCQEAGPKVLEFLIDVATGKDMEQVVSDNGETIGVPAAVKDRIKAAEVVLDRGYGKPDQTINANLDSEFNSIPTALLSTFVAAIEGGEIRGSEGRTGTAQVQ